MLLHKFPYVFALTGIWLGFVCAISFMEAWLKFRAPGIDVPLGLGIGRLVFNALNKVEWVCFALIVLQLFIGRKSTVNIQWVTMGALLLVLLIQTFWFLPVLDARAELLISGQSLPSSGFHFYYVLLEIIKVAVLVFTMIKMAAPSRTGIF